MSAGEWTEQARLLIGRAVRAPSSHNTQPWRFRVSKAAIEVYADRTRALPVNDPYDRELTISCGCAIMNLRAAAAGKGLDARVQLFPVPEEADLLARITFTGHSGDPDQAAALAGFIERRHTYRKRFAACPVDSATLSQLTEAAEREGAWLWPLLAAESRRQVAALVAEGDARQWANPGWRRELAGWMRPRRRGDGLTVAALAAPVARFVVRRVNMGHGVGAKDRAQAEAAPLLAVLCTGGDSPLDWLAAGQALQRILLVACRHGLQASYLNQPIQVASLRARLQNLLGRGFPQILLCCGYPLGEIQAAPRRAVEDVIEAQGGE